ncbi:MAG: thioredoxin family protein [Opitutales bacterium]|nr:thioredoxin family protein [Opitutales bacterium]
MKKFLLSLTAVCSLSFAVLAQADTYPPKGWETDVFKAIEKAKEEDKRVLLKFTGSDWCGFCVALEERIFSKEAFKDYAEEELVLVFVDAPRGIELSEWQQTHNEALRIGFNVEGFPRVILLTPELHLSLVTGYQDVSPEDYVEHLKNDNLDDDLTSEDQAEFAAEFGGFLEQVKGMLATLEQ